MADPVEELSIVALDAHGEGEATRETHPERADTRSATGVMFVHRQFT